MTRADEHDHDPHDHEGDHEPYVVDTRRRRGRVSAPRNPLGGAGRITASRREREQGYRDDAARPGRDPYEDRRGTPRRAPEAYSSGHEGSGPGDGYDERQATRVMPVQPSGPPAVDRQRSTLREDRKSVV